MLRKFVALVAAVVLSASPAFAQTGPSVEVRVRSVDDLLDKVEYLGDILNQAEGGKQAVAFVQNLADAKKGIEGIDPTRPVGLYGVLTKDVVDSPAILMIPLADEAAFLELLSGKLSLDPKKGENGVYEIAVPNVPAPVFFCFANKYVYVTVQDAKHLDAKKLTSPKDFFTKTDDAVLTAQVHLDRIPADVAKVVLGQYELKAADAKKAKLPGETDGAFQFRGWQLDQLTDAVALLANHGKELNVRLVVEPKTDDLTLEATFTAKEGSPLAKLLKGLAGRTGSAAGLPLPAGGMARGSLKLGLTSEAKKDFGSVLDVLVQEFLGTKKDFELQVAKMGLEAILPTLKAGEVEFGFHVSSPDAKGHFALLAAIKVTEGMRIDKALKQFAPFVPEDQGKLEIDVEKIGSIALHKATVANPALEAVFGTKRIWIGTSETLLLVSVEPEGTAIRAAAKAVPSKVGIANASLAVSQLVAATEKGLSPEKLQALATEAFGKPTATGADAVTLTVVGGDSVKVRFNVKGKAVKFAALVDQEKKK